jgi:tRNA(fMet)-specific endonuclease VapC
VLDNIERAGLENCFISEITLAELKYGAENSKNPEKHHTQVDYLSSLITILPINGVLNDYAKEKARLRKAGQLVDDFDLLIGATAITNNLVMITNNTKHLGRLEGIEIEDWTADPNQRQFIKVE